MRQHFTFLRAPLCIRVPAKACKSASQWRIALSLMRSFQHSGLPMDAFACSAATWLKDAEGILGTFRGCGKGKQPFRMESTGEL